MLEMYLVKEKRIFSIAIYLLFFFLVYFLSISSPWLGDDIDYMFNFSDASRIESILDIFESQSVHYFKINGRIFAHFLVQLFVSLLGVQVFAICNSLIYLAFILLTLNLLGYSIFRIRYQIFLICVAFLSLHTKFVPTCQIGYIWMFTFNLMVIKLFFSIDKGNAIIYLALMICSFLAGFGNEALNIGLAAIAFVYLITNFSHLSSIKKGMLVSYMLGVCMLVLAPGNFERINNSHSINYDIVNALIKSVFYYLTYNWFVFLFIIVIGFNHKLRSKVWSSQLLRYLLLGILVLFLFNIFIGVGINRQLFGINMFVIILVMKLLNFNSKAFVLIANISLIVLMAYIIKNDFSINNRRRHILNTIVESCKQSKDGLIFYDLNYSDFTFSNYDPCDAYDERIIKGISRLYFEDRDFIKVYPTILRRQNLNNHYDFKNRFTRIIVNNKTVPQKIVVKRNFIIMGFAWKFKDYNVNLKSPTFKYNDISVYDIPEFIPFIKNYEVQFV